MEKQIAQEIFDELVKAIREKRAFLIVDSKSHGYTCYFQVCSLGENGGSFTYMGLMNFLGFKQWKNRSGMRREHHGMCRPFLVLCLGQYPDRSEEERT